MVVFKTSKNKVSFSDDSKEKGKAITSSAKCIDIFSFLNIDDSSNAEFTLTPYPSDDFEAFSLKMIVDCDTDCDEECDKVCDKEGIPSIDEVIEKTTQAINDSPVVAEDNNGNELTAQDISESVQSEVAAAEVKSFESLGVAGLFKGIDQGDIPFENVDQGEVPFENDLHEPVMEEDDSDWKE
jgi:hypothetical protein